MFYVRLMLMGGGRDHRNEPCGIMTCLQPNDFSGGYLCFVRLNDHEYPVFKSKGYNIDYK